MKITEVSFDFIEPKNGLMAFAKVVISNNLVLRSIAIHRKLNSSGYRLTFPKKGDLYVFNPCTYQASKYFEDIVLTEFKKYTK